MKFKVKWQVRAVNDSRDDVLASGEVIKEAASENELRGLIDTELKWLLGKQFPTGPDYNTEIITSYEAAE